MSWGGPGVPTEWPFELSPSSMLSHILCCLWLLSNSSILLSNIPLHRLLFVLFLIKSSGEESGREESLFDAGLPGGLTLCCGKQHEQLMWGGLPKGEMTPTFTVKPSKDWGTVSQTSTHTVVALFLYYVRTLNGKNRALMDQEGQSGDGVERSFLYCSGSTVSRPPASHRETEQTFFTWKGAVTAPGCHLV